MKVQLIEKYFAEPGNGFPKDPVIAFNYPGFKTRKEAEKFITIKTEKDIKRGSRLVLDGELTKIYPKTSTKPESYHFWYVIVEE